ncbi:MAG: chemotaxis protein CheW [Pseudomonadota bacterium]
MSLTPKSREIIQYVTIRLADQLLGLPVLQVQDVLKAQPVTRVPRAPGWVAGVLNLRGRIVTAIDLRGRLGLTPRSGGAHQSMSIVVDRGKEPFAFLIDSVGEVLHLDRSEFEKNPVTLDPRWRQVSAGVFRLDSELLVILDIDALINIEGLEAA